MSPELVLQFLAWNAEATARCETLSPAGAAPGNVRSLAPDASWSRSELLHNATCMLECKCRNTTMDLQTGMRCG